MAFPLKLRSPACLLVLTLESAVTLEASGSPLKLQHLRLCNLPSSNTPVLMLTIINCFSAHDELATCRTSLASPEQPVLCIPVRPTNRRVCHNPPKAKYTRLLQVSRSVSCEDCLCSNLQSTL